MKKSFRLFGVRRLALFLVAGVWTSVSATAAGFDVVGLQNMTVRMGKSLDDNPFVWMGDHLPPNGQHMDLIRVDDGGSLVLQSAAPDGAPLPQGALFEFFEYSLLAVTDTHLSLRFGRARIITGMEVPSSSFSDSAIRSDPEPTLLGTPFGIFKISQNSVVDADINGQRILFFCLAGEASYSNMELGENLRLPAGNMIHLSVGGRREARPTPPEIQNMLESRQFSQMRYTGSHPPRLLWFSPMPGRTSNQQRVDVLGRVDLSQGPVEIAVNDIPLQVENSGLFSTTLKIRGLEDTVVVRVKRDVSAGTLVLRAGVDTTPPELRLDPFPDTTYLRQVLISGTLSEPAAVALSGNTALSSKGRIFGRPMNLNPGNNAVRLTAFDRAGNRGDTDFHIYRETYRVGESKDSIGVDEKTPPETRTIDAPIIARAGWKKLGFTIEIESPPPANSEYRVYRSFSPDGPFLIVGGTDRNEFTDPGSFEPGISYYYRVSAVSEIGTESPMSDAVQFVPAQSKLSPPANLTARIDANKLRLFWSRDGSLQTGGYNVYRISGPNLDAVRVASVPAPPYIMDLPDTFSELVFRVRAVSAYSMEESDWSENVVVRR